MKISNAKVIELYNPVSPICKNRNIKSLNLKLKFDDLIYNVKRGLIKLGLISRIDKVYDVEQ